MIKSNMLWKALISDLTASVPKEERAVIRSLMLDVFASEDPTLDQFLEAERILDLSVTDSFIDTHGSSVAEAVFFGARFFRKMDCGILRSSTTETLCSFAKRQDNLAYEELDDDLHKDLRKVVHGMLGSLSVSLLTPAVFKHGPGSTAEGRLGVDKSSVPFPDTLEEISNVLNFDPIKRIRTEPTDVATKITTVPKDWRGERVIGMEPTWNMVLQLGVKDLLEQRLLHLVPFHDQTKQTSLLRRDDAYRLCTVDLSNASDHISVDLAKAILPADWFHLLSSVRTQKYCLPSGQVGRTESFALMGNGFCFPFLSLVTLAGAIVAHCRAEGFPIPFGLSACLRFCQREGISTFGDDLILPRDSINQLRYVFSRMRLVMNEKKCGFGLFREACGTFQFRGRIPFTSPSLKANRWTEDTYPGLVRLHNTLLKTGFEKTASCLFASAPSQVPRCWDRVPGVDEAPVLLTSTLAKSHPIRRSKKRGKFLLPLVVDATKKREIHLADSSGWFQAFHGHIPRNESVGPRILCFPVSG